MGCWRFAWGWLFLFALGLIGSAEWARADQAASSPPPLLTLDNAVQIAINNNRLLKITSLDVNKSNWQVAAAKTHYFPSFNIYLFGSKLLNSANFTFEQGIFGKVDGFDVPSQTKLVPVSNGISGNALGQIEQPLSQLYKLHLFVREQELSTDLASQKVREQRQGLVKDVKQAYYAVLQSQSVLDSNAASIKQYQELDRVANERLAQEALLKSESLDVKAKLAQQQYERLQYQDQLQTRKEQLNDLMGRDISVDFRTEEVPAASFSELDLKAAQQTALDQRPEIKEAEIQVKQADYDRRIAKAAYIPDLSAAVHYVSPLNTEILPRNMVSAGMVLSWEPFEWGRKRDEVNQKKIIVDQAQLQLQEAQSKVLQDVNNRFRKLGEARMLLTVAQAARDAATEKLRETTQKFEQQTVLLRDVLQQQASVASADNDYEEALLSFWNSKADFAKALGED